MTMIARLIRILKVSGLIPVLLCLSSSASDQDVERRNYFIKIWSRSRAYAISHVMSVERGELEDQRNGRATQSVFLVRFYQHRAGKT